MMKFLHYFLSIRRTTIVALVFLFATMITTYAPVVAAQDGSVPPASDSTGGSIPQETSTVKDPTVTPDAGVPPTDATGSGTATPVDPVRPVATSSSQTTPQDPAPASPSNNTETPVSQAGNITDNQISVSETQTTGTSSDTSTNGWTPLFAGVGIGTLLGGIGVYRIRRQGKDTKSKSERCERIAETLAGKKQALTAARGKFSIQETLMRELEKKLDAAKKDLENLVKDAAKDAVVSLDKSGNTKAVVDAAERAKKAYEDIKRQIEQAREIYETLKSLLGQLTGEVDTLEASYQACVLGAMSSSKAMKAGKKLVLPTRVPTKELKFSVHAIPLMKDGETYTTVRFFDEKDLTKGDTFRCINSAGKDVFATADIVAVREKKFIDLTPNDFAGDIGDKSIERMRDAYQGYYEGKIQPDSVAKIVTFIVRKEQEEEGRNATR